MTKVKAKQIDRVLSGAVRVGSFSAVGVDDVVSTTLGTVLSTAGKGGVSVPAQVSGDEDSVGIIVASPGNRVEIWESLSKNKILAANGEEVYGRLSETSGAYTLSYHTFSDAGVEAAYSFASATNIDFEFAYRYDFHRLPSDAIIGAQARNIAQDPTGTGGKQAIERLTVTATNTLSNLTKTPISATGVKLIVFGVTHDALGGASADFTVNTVTRAVTWSAANAEYPLEVGDRVTAEYFTNE
jgi:hypothetical protein